MALPALKIELENPVEERIARLEVNVENIQSNLQRLETKVDRLDIKIDEVDKRLCGKIDEVDRRLSGKIDDADKRLSGKIDDADKRLSGKIDDVKDLVIAVNASIAALALSTEKALGRQRVWFLLIGAGLLAVIARAFKWV